MGLKSIKLKSVLRNILAFSLFIVFIIQVTSAQQEPERFTGYVFLNEDGNSTPGIGVNVYWSGTTLGSVTDENGFYSIEPIDDNRKLVVSYVGFTSDTILVGDSLEYTTYLKGNLELEQVEVVKRVKSTQLSMLNPLKIEHVNEAELEKAACCNLSESFETNPSVDVSFTDAITGTKQIQMLGLAGPYTQITFENIPTLRGSQRIYGLEYIPGPWIESIQLSKGTGSVANGFESMTGQINVELRKPNTADRLYFNAFANTESRLESNLNLSQKISNQWSTALLLHAKNQSVDIDHNQDGFKDKPTGQQYIFLNRWKYSDNKGLQSQVGIKGVYNNLLGGQVNFSPDNSGDFWGMQMKTNGIESWLKLGKVSNRTPGQSFGFQLAGSAFDQDFRFGNKEYLGEQRSIYGNFIFQSQFKNPLHSFRTGMSMQSDVLNESLDSLHFLRNENAVGTFFEYTFSSTDNFDIVGGLRADFHNIYGLFLTPRLHLRYGITQNIVIRLSAGRGQRTASILTENSAVLASSRNIILPGNNTNKPYGLNQEIAWNFGTNLSKNFILDYREGIISFDLYQTHFSQQVVVDLDDSPQTILFYGLKGKSYSLSFQAMIDYEVLRRLDARLAYRWYNVKTELKSGLQTKPLLSSQRAFMNLAYSTRNYWKFDYTLQWQNPKRLPGTLENPVQYRLEEYSPDFILMNLQTSKEWKEKFEVYFGIENLLDFKQENPILASDDPFGPYFDSSIIWGPVFGRMIYAGIRFKIL